MAAQPISATIIGMTKLVLFLIALLVTPILPAAAEEPLDAASAAAFLERIGGAWQGQAVITPIGPRPYDIRFAHNDAGEIEGAAEPGGATHTWTFRQRDSGLTLRFLSTFRGNRQPILLTASGMSDGAVIFHALRPDFLQVRIRADAQTLVMRVFHGDRLHVEIRLQRQ
jgi:hypothetical protein